VGVSGRIQPSIPPETVPQSRSDNRVADARGVYASRAADRGTGAGYKNSEIGTIPVDWDLLPLGSLYRFSNGVNADKEAYGQGTPFINVLEVITNSHLQEPHIPGKVLLGKTERETFSVLPGDVLFNRTSETQEEVGLSAVYCGQAPVVFGGFVIRGRAVSNLLDATYAGYGLRALSVRRQIVAQGQGAIRSNIGQASLRRVQVPLPILDEQRAIAEALSDVDGLLRALDALIAKKRAIKQAAMQQLLTGKTRLPGFSGEWGEKKLGDLSEMGSGGTPPTSNRDYYGGGIPWVSISDMTNVGRVIRHTERTLSAAGLANSATQMFPAGTVLYAMYASIGECSVAGVPLCTSQAILGIRPRGGLNATFLYHWLCDQKDRVKGLGQQGTQANLSKALVQSLCIRCPKIEEQEAVASVLDDIDIEIAALERRREKTRSMKQGMMQQLLTGRVRLIQPTGAADA